jgi:hypothetical protein
MKYLLTKEKLIRLAHVKRPDGGRVHVATAFRWAQRGIRGEILETTLVGGQRYTSEEALERFFARATEAAAGNPHPVRSPRQRQAAVNRANAALAKRHRL